MPGERGQSGNRGDDTYKIETFDTNDSEDGSSDDGAIRTM